MLLHVFRLHGFLRDVMSGPQFVFKFCSLLGASVSLSSGYHPQSNGQELETRLRCLVAQNPGASISFGWSMHTTHCPAHPLLSPLFSAPMGTSLLCSPLWRKSPVTPQPKLLSDHAIRFGVGPVRCCFVSLLMTREWLTEEGPKRPPTHQDNGFGSPPGICV